MSVDQWPRNNPQTLLETCLEYCSKHLDSTICDYNSSTKTYRLKPGISLPPSVGDELFRSVPLQRKHLGIFCDPESASCKRLNLDMIHDLRDEELKQLLIHRPFELRLSSEHLTSESVDNINTYGQNLNTLLIVGSAQLFTGPEIDLDAEREIEDVEFAGRVGPSRADGKVFGCNYMFECPQLRSLTFRHYPGLLSTLDCALSCLPMLTKVDLSDCDISVDGLHRGLCCLRCVQILRLQNVPLNTLDVKRSFEVISHLKSLRYLQSS